jgi:hypothetical protein
MIQRVVAFIFLLCALVALHSIASQNYNMISAVTSASGRFRIIEGKAYTTTASITWWDYYNNGNEQALKWGTSADDYTNSINLKPFAAQTNITTTITDLVPNTQYYIQFYRLYKGDDYSINETFTTFNNAGLTAKPHHTRLPTIDLRNRKVEAYLLNGRRAASVQIANQPAPASLDRSVITMFGLQPGMYLFVVKEPGSGAVIAMIRKTVIRWHP